MKWNENITYYIIKRLLKKCQKRKLINWILTLEKWKILKRVYLSQETGKKESQSQIKKEENNKEQKSMK